jgi:hypothetical protein
MKSTMPTHTSKFTLLLLLLLLVILSSILSQIGTKTKLLKLKNLEEKYNLTSSKFGRDGIDSALNILLNQEEQAMRIRPIVYPKNFITSLLSSASSSSSSSSSSISTSDSSITQALLPLCEVSYSQIMMNGIFFYLGTLMFLLLLYISFFYKVVKKKFSLNRRTMYI